MTAPHPATRITHTTRTTVRRNLTRALVVAAVTLTLTLLSPIVWSFILCPWMGTLRDGFPEKTSMMKTREADAAAKKKPFKLTYRPVPLKRISRELQRAAVAGEDAGFYKHNGFEFAAIREAFEHNQKKGRVVRGGSTISQQVAKNLWLTPRRSYWRKAVEAVLTFRMEATLPKERILELYLNIIEWGPGIFGAEAAAQVHFNTPAARLTRDQAILLAAAIPAPLRFNAKKPSTFIQRRTQRIADIMAASARAPSSGRANR